MTGQRYTGPTLTEEQALIITAYTEILCVPFPRFQAYAERLLGRPIMSHEFGSHGVWPDLKKAVAADFFALLGRPLQ